LFVYSVMMWRTSAFMSQYTEKGYAFFCGKTGTYPVSKLSSVIIKRTEDLMLADFILQALAQGNSCNVKYDELIQGVEVPNE